MIIITTRMKIILYIDQTPNLKKRLLIAGLNNSFIILKESPLVSGLSFLRELSEVKFI